MHVLETTYLVLRVEAGVDDAVHVQVQVVVDAIGAAALGLFVPRRRRPRRAGASFVVFLGGDDDVGVLAREPLIEGGTPMACGGAQATSGQLQAAASSA